MPLRYRERPNLPYRYRFDGGPWNEAGPPYGYETMYDVSPGGGMCAHIKRVQALNYHAPPWKADIENFDIPSFLYTPPPLTTLDWANLPTSTEVNIIVLLTEMDEILAMLCKKFWRQLSYGAITWGIVPLISEIESGLKAIQNIAKSIDGTQYEATNYKVINYDVGDIGGPHAGMQWKAETSIKYHAYGKAYYKELELSSLLDRIGFHPDPATLWELVPFSFVVDYILPIGKFLNGLRRGGWVKAVYFDGWVSAKVTTTGYMYNPPWHTWKYVPERVPFEYRAYFRHPHASVLVAPEADLPQFELPTFEEAFNMAYLANKKLRSVVPPIHWDWVFSEQDT